MYAELKKEMNRTIAEFNRDLPYPIDKVWQMIGDNAYLKKWFAELNIVELVKGGKITFGIGGGDFEEMTITEVKVPNVLEFTWDKDIVRFELSTNPDGKTHMVFKEIINTITEHTPRDIAGWHICLDNIGALLNGEYSIPDETTSWEKLYEYYKIKFNKLKKKK